MAATPRSPSNPLEIAIIGAGPIGLEAAIYASALGHRPTVYERFEAGANIRRWGFLRLFSPWKLNTSPLGLAALEAQGLPIPQMEEYPGGGEYCDRYLAPLAAADSWAGIVCELWGEYRFRSQSRRRLRAKWDRRKSALHRTVSSLAITMRVSIHASLFRCRHDLIVGRAGWCNLITTLGPIPILT